MSKFKKGDWLFEDDAEPGDTVGSCRYYVYDVLPNGKYVLALYEGEYGVYPETYVDSCRVEPRCTGWDWVLPEPAERFGLKTGDKVTVRGHYRRGDYVIAAIDDTYRDGIARFDLEGDGGGLWHPYWFGLCQMDGSPLPPSGRRQRVKC